MSRRGPESARGEAQRPMHAGRGCGGSSVARETPPPARTQTRHEGTPPETHQSRLCTSGVGGASELAGLPERPALETPVTSQPVTRTGAAAVTLSALDLQGPRPPWAGGHTSYSPWDAVTPRPNLSRHPVARGGRDSTWPGCPPSPLCAGTPRAPVNPGSPAGARQGPTRWPSSARVWSVTAPSQQYDAGDTQRPKSWHLRCARASGPHTSS